MGKYNFHPVENVSAEQRDRMNIFNLKFEEISEDGEAYIKPGRLLSMAQTKLEEAAMLFNKAIAHDGLND